MKEVSLREFRRQPWIDTRRNNKTSRLKKCFEATKLSNPENTVADGSPDTQTSRIVEESIYLKPEIQRGVK